MPIYEYGCYGCRKRVDIFFRTFAAAQEGVAVCPNCGGAELKRLISQVGVVRSEESRMESLADPSNLAGLESGDPKQLARLMRRMKNEMGDAGEMGEMDGEFNEIIERLEAGEDPESIDSAMGGSNSGGNAYPDWNPS